MIKRLAAAGTDRSRISRTPPERAWPYAFAAWLLATISTLGGLFLGEVMGITPCVLCWYQRIFMFPLVFVLAAGLLPLDPRLVRYAMPLAVGGWVVSLYHLLLVAGLIPQAATPCTAGVPCSDAEVVFLGFVTIPLMSFAAFTMITALLLITHFKSRK
jgi:disulfide bond formation protein DsbB